MSIQAHIDKTFEEELTLVHSSDKGARYFRGRICRQELNGDRYTFGVPEECLITGELPQGFPTEAISHFTLHNQWECPYRLRDAFRRGGRYSLGSAGALVRWWVPSLDDNETLSCEVKVTSSDFRDLVDLFLRIRAGEITPVEPWDNEQIVSPARELRDLWREMWRLIGRNIRDWFRNQRANINRRFARRISPNSI